MAEILLKITDGANYSDGDCLCAFNNRHIHCVHAQHICHLDAAGFQPNGLRPNGSLPQRFREKTSQYRFNRISETEVRRTEIATGVQEIFGPESIDVREFLKRRKKHHRHAIFGVEGEEVWYGGRTDFSQVAVDAVWSEIESHSTNRRRNAEFGLWPMGRLDIRHHLAVRFADFTDDEAQGLVAPQLELDLNGDPVLDADGREVVIAKRNINVDWRNELLDDLGVTEAQVLNRDFPVGQDVEVAPGQFRYESKSQRVQDNRAKLFSKSLGGRIPPTPGA